MEWSEVEWSGGEERIAREWRAYTHTDDGIISQLEKRSWYYNAARIT